MARLLRGARRRLQCENPSSRSRESGPFLAFSKCAPHPSEVNPVEVALDTYDTFEGAFNPGELDLSVAEQVLLDAHRAPDAQHEQLDANTTDDPRTRVLDPSAARALRLWREMNADDRPFEAASASWKAAQPLRRRLRIARVEREVLHERSAAREPTKSPHLRATFVTLALATGETETWIADRTG